MQCDWRNSCDLADTDKWIQIFFPCIPEIYKSGMVLMFGNHCLTMIMETIRIFIHTVYQGESQFFEAEKTNANSNIWYQIRIYNQYVIDVYLYVYAATFSYYELLVFNL
ncbi:hypothetical protein Cni_G17330 [Canna indica]|uniref:Uncharacterized protein n=1 Tax=Canna indica TaxID=4628 RepID=A0AAQ3KH72_9LILI|nr:hypothetical protein Cni_G17330 [Canna indica]